MKLEFRSSPRIELSCEDPAGRLSRRQSCLESREHAGIGVLCGSGRIDRSQEEDTAGAGLGGGRQQCCGNSPPGTALPGTSTNRPGLLSLSAEPGSDVPFFLSGGDRVGKRKGVKDPSTARFPSGHLGDRLSRNPGFGRPKPTARSIWIDFLRGGTIEFNILPVCCRQANCSLTGIFNDFEASVLAAHPPVLEPKPSLKSGVRRRQCCPAADHPSSDSSLIEESALAASREISRRAGGCFRRKTLSRAEYFQHMFG